MSEENLDISGSNLRMKKHSDTERTSAAIPGWLLRLIDEEAQAKGKTRNLVISYLIFCGLKAHVGEFQLPANNTIKENYIRRGRKWMK